MGICRYLLFITDWRLRKTFTKVLHLHGCTHRFLASIGLQDGSFGCLASFAFWKYDRSSWDCYFISFSFLLEDIKALARFCIKIALGDPSSSSSRPLLMYVKVPDPVPVTGRSKYNILTYFCTTSSVAVTSKTMMDL